eukprot:CAMPEP_0114561448 /NCGR_PEP_ID=MMETSP0114-20121206/12010_1 /TAXON_ID=31324 /ORGANISM="Goniomonas sp, Strain m" /LENGTH=492 /DNA_ID=CAMNT_0001747085 /DNA_START=51 /DNA_END=1529 /DNA_ORIENTATION=-
MEQYTISVKTFQFQTYDLTVSAKDTIASLKAQLTERLSVSAQQQRLIHACKELDDSSTLGEANVGPSTVIFLVLKLQGVQQVVVRFLDDREMVLEANSEETIDELKARIEAKTNTPVARQRLIANGKELQDGDRIIDHITDVAQSRIVLHLLVRPSSANLTPTGRSGLEALDALRDKINSRVAMKGVSSDEIDPSFGSSGTWETQSTEQAQPDSEQELMFADMLDKNNLADLSSFGDLNDSFTAEVVSSPDDIFADASPITFADTSSAAMMDFMDCGSPVVPSPRTPSFAQASQPATPLESVAPTRPPFPVPAASPAVVSPAPQIKTEKVEQTKPIAPQTIPQIPKNLLGLPLLPGFPGFKSLPPGAAAAAAAAAQLLLKAPVAAQAPPPPAPLPVTRKGVKTELTADERLRKRLLKNRLSAERSRQRKQAYMEELEYKLSLSKSENAQLQDRVKELECSLSTLTMMIKQPGVLDSSAMSQLQPLLLATPAH